MSAAALIDLGIYVVLALAAVALFRLCFTPRPSARRMAWDFATEKWVRLPSGAAPGPGQMTAGQIAEADPLELLYLAPAFDAELDAGCARMWDAIRDEQQKGETA